jgi:hypothetical protein
MEAIATDFDQLAALLARRRAEGVPEVWLAAMAAPPRAYAASSRLSPARPSRPLRPTPRPNASGTSAYARSC